MKPWKPSEKYIWFIFSLSSQQHWSRVFFKQFFIANNRSAAVGANKTSPRRLCSSSRANKPLDKASLLNLDVIVLLELLRQGLSMYYIIASLVSEIKLFFHFFTAGLSTIESVVEVDNRFRFNFVQSIKQCQHCVINVNTNTTFLSAASNINILVFPLYFDFL